MLYLIWVYWPFMLVAGLVGIVVGWWYQDPRSVDDVTAWLERSSDEP